jgi:hypothetical protein
MMSYIYGCESTKDDRDDETKNEIFVIDNYNDDDNQLVHLTDLQQCFKTWKEVTESATCDSDCPYYNKEEEGEQGEGEGERDDGEEEEEDGDEQNNECEDRLNYNDMDESSFEEKIYIISMNNIPYFYDDNLSSIRNTMWDIANNLLKDKDNDFDSSKHYILTNNSNEIKIICPYNFLWFFNYNHTVAELKIDYAVKYNAIIVKNKQE